MDYGKGIKTMSTMQRVTAKRPCPICKKTDWCLIGKTVVLCMRAYSPKSKTLADGSVGYLHSTSDEVYIYTPNPKEERRTIPCREILSGWNSRLGFRGVNRLAESLSVTEASLLDMGCQPAPYFETFGFPMQNGSGHIVGIRLRNLTGAKWAERGSHQGLFVPQTRREGSLFIVEGPTDAAAAVMLGVNVIGRPSCSGGVFDIMKFISEHKINRVVIVADSDRDRVSNGRVLNPGNQGASALSVTLKVPHCTVMLPCKDMREFVKGGGTINLLDYIVSQCIWRNT